MHSRGSTVGAVLVLLLAMTSVAHADVSPSDAAAARSLFDEARALLQAGKAAEACPKLEESQRLDPGMGTMFNLADCYERVGKTASAWSLFLSVASQAKATRQPERERAARERASSLEPNLSRLAVVVPSGSEVADLSVTRDGAVIGRGSWGSGVAVDPGEHVIGASAPGRVSWQKKVVVSKPAAVETVTVPILEVAKPGESTAGAAHSAEASRSSAARAVETRPDARDEAGASPSYWGPMRFAGLGALGLGGAGLVVGTVYGLKRNSKQDDAKTHCVDYPNGCDDIGMSLNSEASSAGKVAVAGFVAGGVLVAAGAVLLLIPQPKPSSTQGARIGLMPVAGVRGGGVELHGRW